MNCTNNHKCSNCGQCCMPVLPITMEEYYTISDYIKTNHVEAVPSLVGNDFHIDCPFHDYKNNKCNIYEVRPEVCRNFLCSHTEKRINKDRTYYDQRADINGIHLDRFAPFDLLFYDNPLLSLYFAQDILGPKCNEEKLLDVLYKMGKGLDDSIPNTKQIADAIKEGKIKLEWSGK